MKKVLVIGSTGMLGHVVKKYLIDKKYDVYATTRHKDNKYYFDALEDAKKIEEIIASIKPDFIVNCIGILNKKAEDYPSQAILVNSYFPHYLDEMSEKYNYKLIHISTDCVFSGHDGGSYKEDSPKTATTVYGTSKALGEINNNRSLTLRTSIIGPDTNPNGIGLFQWFMKQKGEVHGFRKAVWSGVTTIELAKQIEIAMNSNLTGLYHITNGQKINKYDLLTIIKDVFNKDIEIIPDDNYTCDKSLVITREDYKFNIPSYHQMIVEMKEWIEKNKDIYGGF